MKPAPDAIDCTYIVFETLSAVPAVDDDLLPELVRKIHAIFVTV